MTVTPDHGLSSAAAEDAVAAALRQAVERLDGRTRAVCRYHLGDDRHGAGKGIRPKLALWAAAAGGGPAQRGVPAAAACELLHNFSLLHDDVMDGDRQRRHRPSAWVVYGTSAAILAGDALLSLAGEVLAETRSPAAAWAVRRLGRTTRALIAGQSADLAFEAQREISLPECLRMSSDKTAALFACSASLGATLGEAEPDVVRALEEYGRHLGVAFQLSDDLLGIWGSPARTGKPALSDLRARKKTVPVTVALHSETAAGRRLRSWYCTDHPLAEADLPRAAELVEEAGGRRWTEEAIHEHVATARAALADVALSPELHSRLEQLARGVGPRER